MASELTDDLANPDEILEMMEELRDAAQKQEQFTYSIGLTNAIVMLREYAQIKEDAYRVALPATKRAIREVLEETSCTISGTTTSKQSDSTKS